MIKDEQLNPIWEKPVVPDIDLIAQANREQAKKLLRLEALETVSASKLSLAQIDELVTLREQYGSTYDRKLQLAQKKFSDMLSNSSRFESLRSPSKPSIIREQLETLDKYTLPEKNTQLTPQAALEIRALLTNRLVTVSALRRHATRMSGILEGDVELAEETWMGMSPADREWRMKGEMAQLLDTARSTARDHKLLAAEADGVYWNLVRLLETLERMTHDWDRIMGMSSHTGGIPQQAQSKMADDKL